MKYRVKLERTITRVKWVEVEADDGSDAIEKIEDDSPTIADTIVPETDITRAVTAEPIIESE